MNKISHCLNSKSNIKLQKLFKEQPSCDNNVSTSPREMKFPTWFFYLHDIHRSDSSTFSKNQNFSSYGSECVILSLNKRREVQKWALKLRMFFCNFQHSLVRDILIFDKPLLAQLLHTRTYINLDEKRLSNFNRKLFIRL